ncbi:RGS22-like protein [Mya arenaria]|uniref:RGS22-like protein n=1 Tax=Mya arenaria TaxID=6604 RepID=A0ABY7FQ62_MYAAR|nr:RGS22-like protein [Mya arenaria]
MALFVNQSKTLEDFLATDDLFVEYFNIFLALPTFPEPLCFNKDTGGFEVVSHAKKELAQKIKEALRSQARKLKIYRVAKKHSFINIPLIPIEDDKEPKNQEIHTSFSVTTLNKEQGIHWVKAERLPSFLESDLYLEYRLSKLLAQARAKKKKDEEEVPVDPREELMADMYVCMGNAPTTDTDSWYATAKVATEMATTAAGGSRPNSERVRPLSSTRPTSARPMSAYSDAYHRSDSGLGTSSINSSAKNVSYGSRYHSARSDDDIMSSKLYEGKHVPRITDELCVVGKDRPHSSVVYSIPKRDPNLESLDDDDLGIINDDLREKDDEKDSGKGDDENADESMEADVPKSVTVKNIDEVGSIIVGVVLKKAIEKLTNMDESDIENLPEIQHVFKNKDVANLTVEMLDKVTFIEEGAKPVDGVEKKETEQKITEQMRKNLDEESDVDSLLDSEEDYEESDLFFRKHKHKTYSLSSRKGVDQFKKFLKGTLGERNWKLWVDIDRMRLMAAEDIPLYLCWLRERFHKPGAEFELSPEQKYQLGLHEPSAWTLDKLLNIQNLIAEPLVLAPRFLLKQMMRTNPDRNLLYTHMKHVKTPAGIDPSPPTASLLPLRPKSCLPRVRQQETSITFQDQFHGLQNDQPTLSDTSPPVGLKRTYAEPTLKFIANWQREQSVHTQLLSPSLQIDRTSTPRLKRPVSAKTPKSMLNVSMMQRPKSAVVKSMDGLSNSRRPSTARSSISRVSVESATGRVRIKSPTKQSTPRSRPSSAASSIASVRSEDLESIESEFLGGERMEHMLQALHKESEAGGFFRRYVERSNCKSIYSKYITVGAQRHIGLDGEACKDIRAHLDPPFEELFDAAEEHAIMVVHQAWQEMWENDQKTYHKRVSTPDVMEGYEDPAYDETLLSNIPEEFKDYTLEKLVHNRIELEHFRNFLAENYASMDIMCWMDIEAFRRILHTDEKKRDVAEAGGGWGKLLEDRPPNPMILEAQKYVQERLEKKWLPLFLVTPDFAVRQKPRTNMDDVVDDVIVQKKKKSLNMLKEIIIFRKALLNPVTSLQFRRFVSIKGDSLENDVLFWLEVQKYKDMYHAHSEEAMIVQKINTIINCFIDSQIPPSLQIDIPQEMADRILDRKYEKSPYLFREAQFSEFRLNIAEEKVLPTIERRRRHTRAKERKQQQLLEEKQARAKFRLYRPREAERRAALGLPPLGEDDEFHDPFKALAGAESVEGDGDGEDKDKISWTYSSYVNGLEREQMLNNTDESSFTSLLTDTGRRRSSNLSSLDVTRRMSRQSRADSIHSQRITFQEPKSSPTNT